MTHPPESLSAGTAICSITGQSHALDDLVEFDGRLVSAEGKAVLLESLRSGENLPGEIVKASLLRRFFAMILDLYIVYLPLIFLNEMLPWRTSDLMDIGAPLVLVGYFILATIMGGQTIGKTAMKIRVTMKVGLRVTVLAALLRSVICLLPFIILLLMHVLSLFIYSGRWTGLIYLIWIITNLLATLIDRKAHRSVHDRVAGTRVILCD